MTALATVTIDRTSLSLSDLVIDSEGFGTYYIDKAGLGRPGTAWDETFADDSPWIDGRVRTAAKKQETTLPLTVRVQAESSAALDTAVAALEAALEQFVYEVTVTVDGVAKTYRAYVGSTIQSTDGLIDVERVRGFHEDFAIAIPIYPNAVA